MPLDPSGNYTLRTEYNVAPNTVIISGDYKVVLEDIRGALNAAAYRDGRAALTGNLTFAPGFTASSQVDGTGNQFVRASQLGVFSRIVGTRAALIAATIAAGTPFIDVAGYTSAVDGQGGRYYAISAPGSVKAWHAQNVVDNSWWELRVTDAIKPTQLGAVSDGIADDTTPVQAAHDYAAAFKVDVDTDGKVYAIPSAGLTIDNGVTLRGGGTYRRTTGVATVLLSATNKAAPKVLDVTLDMNVWTVSSTSNTVGTGSKTFAVPSTLGYINGDSILIVASDARNYMKGVVTAYAAGSLTINVATASDFVGSGTFTSWTVIRNDGNVMALRFTGCTDAVVDGAKFTGRWYAAVEYRNCTGGRIENNSFATIVNRPIFLQAVAGALTGVRVVGNVIDGSSFSQYGINLLCQPGQVFNDVTVTQNTVKLTIFQGIETGGGMTRVSVIDNGISDVLAVNGIGILVQEANASQPQDISVYLNRLTNCGGASGAAIIVRDAFYCNVESNKCIAGVNGIKIFQSSGTFACTNNNATGNIVRAFTGKGIEIAAFTGGGMAGTRTDRNDVIGTGGTTTGIEWNALAAPSVKAIGNTVIGATTAYVKGAALAVDQFNT